MVGMMPRTSDKNVDLNVDPTFIEAERNRYASRNLAYLILLNGAAALVLLAAVAHIPESRLASAMMVFGGGAIAGLLSSFFAYVNRTFRMEVRDRPSVRSILRVLAVLAALGGGVAFLTGLNIVWNISASKTSSHPKGGLQKQTPAPATIEKVLDGGDGTTLTPILKSVSLPGL